MSGVRRTLWSRLRGRLDRDMARFLNRRPYAIRLRSPIVSFTFDDFPRSALHCGGGILREHGAIGTYYTSFGLMGTTAPTGEIFVEEDLKEFVQQGHEMACHTFDHCHSWDTPPEEFEASIVRNQQVIAQKLPGVKMTHLSYPISHPQPDTKRRVAGHYETARGGGQTFNAGVTDLNYLKAFFIEQSRDNFGAIEAVIQENARANGWLVFATHDVADDPTRFGCTPQCFSDVVKCSVDSGASLLCVRDAFQQVSHAASHSHSGCNCR
jgi:peptidoglycan/xylan/chitin deacetylase (PgdA/CDA1 family)